MSEHCCPADEVNLNSSQNKTLKKVFWVVLLINLGMFFAEFFFGLISHSNALVADSLDMLGDTFVYAVSLLVIAKGHYTKANASLAKGGIMALLGLFVIGEALYKIANPLVPSAGVITAIGILALMANAICFWLLSRHKDTDLNVKSAWICSRNDVLGNVSVIGAGLLVGYLGSMWPDIIVGLGIASIILYSSIGIIKEAYKEKHTHSEA